MVEVPPEIRTSLSNKRHRYGALPCGSLAYRTAAINPARKVFEETFHQAPLDPELAGKRQPTNENSAPAASRRERDRATCNKR
jgi:hypothetical protein